MDGQTHSYFEYEYNGGQFDKRRSVETAGSGDGYVDGMEIKMQVEVGQQVIYSKYAGTDVKLEDEEYIIVKQSDILAVVK